jgi:hypothetical protein
MFVLRIYFYISCYYCVICMCIVWRVSLHYPTRKSSLLRDPFAQTTRRGYIVPSPRYFQQVAHPSPGEDRVGSSHKFHSLMND